MKLSRSAILGLLIAIALVPSISAQSRTNVAVGEPFSVTASPAQNGTPATALRLYLDGAQVGSDVTLGVSGEAVFQVPGIATAGLHKLEASALNSFAEGPRSAALTFCVGPLTGCAPAAPTLPRIQVTTKQVFDQVPLEQGGVLLRLRTSETETIEVK